MNDSDSDLQAAFQKQRQTDRQHAPAWNPDLLTLKQQRPATGMSWMRPALAFAALLALCAAGLKLRSHKSDSQDLATLSSHFLSEESASKPALLAALGTTTSTSDWPSDVLRPNHINLVIP